MTKAGPERQKIEKLFVKFSKKSMCLHDIMSMTSLDDEKKVNQIVQNLKIYFFVESAGLKEGCTAKSYAHPAYRAREKLLKKYSDFEETEEEESEEETEKGASGAPKRKYKKRKTAEATDRLIIEISGIQYSKEMPKEELLKLLEEITGIRIEQRD